MINFTFGKTSRLAFGQYKYTDKFCGARGWQWKIPQWLLPQKNSNNSLRSRMTVDQDYKLFIMNANEGLRLSVGKRIDKIVKSLSKHCTDQAPNLRRDARREEKL